jgi:biotin transport system substrate-specific component
MTSTPFVAPRPVLADRIPRVTARGALLVAGGALLTAAAAQVFVPLPFTPVPISGQTFAVLLVAAALGPARGVASMGLYVLLGLVGLPFYAEGASGTAVVMGATGGYLVGFVVAAWVVGHLARRGLDRTVWGTAVAYVAGSLVIYAVGVPWLAVVAGVGPQQALLMGVVPFLIGDAVKAALAAGLLPAAWRLVGEGPPD